MRDMDEPAAGFQSGLTIRHLGVIRWIALAGQLAAILLVHFILGYPLPLAACLALVAVSALLGLVLAIAPGYRRQIGHRSTLLLLVFDTVQLFLLLYLTGGLANPFSVLLVAPVTVSAMLFQRIVTAGLVAFTVILISVLALYHMPLPWPEEFRLDPVYTIGLWGALVMATVFVASYAGMVSNAGRRLEQALAEASLTLERERKMVALGALATSAAHKLGSPLNTITLIAHELDRLTGRDAAPDQDKQLAEDIRQLKEETARCRGILAELNDEALHLDSATSDPIALSAFIDSLMAERFSDISDILKVEAEANPLPQPSVMRRAELIHPVETLVDNAAQFAVNSIEITLGWTEKEFNIAIRDDGPGLRPSVLAALGTPYAGTRRGVDGHMGLGIFIATTMVSNAGGRIHIGNRDSGGAEAVLTYPREGFEAPSPTRTP